MKRVLLTAAAGLAAVVVVVLAVLPARQLVLDRPWNDGTIPGLMHVHTNRSDGLYAPGVVAAAAARAGLRFLVFTDHGNATRTPDPPEYRSGVLCLDAVEISTRGGHYLALDMDAAPYPLGGEARDVVEDVARLGGFGVAAHPDSPKSELRWAEWTAPIDAVEIINPDTSWRVRLADGSWQSRFMLLAALLTYPVRSSETIGRLLTDPSTGRSQWEALIEGRPVVALAGVDAHAKLELRTLDPGDNRYSLPIPGYESSFRALSVRVHPDKPWSGDADADAQTLIRALRRGHLYTVVDAWATPPAFEFTATRAGRIAHEGDEIGGTGPITLQVRSNLPPRFSTTVWQGSRVLTEGRTEQTFTVPAGEAAHVYRVEIRSDDHRDGPPWILSNPIYVRRAPPGPKPASPRVVTSDAIFDGRTAGGWEVESDQTSVAALDVAPRLAGAELRLRFGLSGGALIGQFAGAVAGTPHGVAMYDRVRFTTRAEHPMRVSVQLRARAGTVLERWQRSVYVEPADRERVVRFNDMTAVGEARATRPPLADVSSVMFVIDTTNTKPGASGRIWLSSVKLEKEHR